MPRIAPFFESSAICKLFAIRHVLMFGRVPGSSPDSSRFMPAESVYDLSFLESLKCGRKVRISISGDLHESARDILLDCYKKRKNQGFFQEDMEIL